MIKNGAQYIDKKSFIEKVSKRICYELSQKRAKLCSCDLENRNGCARCGSFCPLKWQEI